MNENYAEQIAKYYEQGWSAQKIANKISVSPDFDGQWDDIYNEAVRLQTEAQKKKESGEPASTGLVSFTSVPSEEPSGSLAQSEATTELGPPTGKSPEPDTQYLVGEYMKRFQEDIAALENKALNEDDDYGDKIRDIMRDDSKSQRQKEYEVQNYRASYFDDQFLNIMEGYAADIANGLPEDADLEGIADRMYEASNGMLAIPLDGDNRYNEGNVIWDMVKSIGAGAVDLVGNLISLTHAGDPMRVAAASAQYGLGEDATFMDKIEASQRMGSQMFADVSGDIRETLPRFGYGANGMLNALGNGNIEDASYQLAMATGEAIPYFGLAAVTGGGAAAAGVLGTVGTINTYTNSEREDYNRIKEGLDPVFEDSASGTWQRAGYALAIGSIQGAAGPVEGRIGKVMLGQAALRPGVASALTFKGVLKARGIDAGLEGITEALEAGADGAYRSLVGNENLDAGDIAFRMLESFAVGAGVGGALQAPATVRDGFRAGRSVITGPQAAVNARAENINLEQAAEGVDQINRDSFRQLLDNSNQSFAEQRSEEMIGRESFYRMIALRFPGTFKTIQDLDVKIESLASQYNAEKAGGANEAKLNDLAGRIYDLVTDRVKITESYSNESLTLTPQEQRASDHATMDHRIETKREDVSVLSDVVRAHEELDGTEMFDVQGYEEAVDAHDRAKEEHENLVALQDMVAEANITHEEEGTPETLAQSIEIENRLRDALGMDRIEGGVEVTEETAKKYTAAEQVKAHNAGGEAKGSTFTLDGKNQAGQKRSSVSIFPERSKIISGELTEDVLQEYVDSNKDLFDGNEDVLAVGTWYDRKANETYLDVSTVVDKESAVSLGEQYNQKSVFDLEFMQEVDTGGTGEAVEGAKSEADRLVDIREIVGKQKPVEQPAQPKKPKRKKKAEVTTEDVNGRGIAGQYTVLTPKGDGSISAVSVDGLTRDDAKAINNVSKTLNKVFGEKFKFVVHSTEESGNMADGKGGQPIAGYFVSYKDGSVEIHMNPTLIRNKQAETGKTFKKILAEEVFHAMFSSSIANSLNTNPQALNSFVSELETIAVKSGNKDLISAVENKKNLYREQVTSDEAVLVDEAIAEYVSELFDSMGAAGLSETIIDKIRVAINRFVSKITGKEAKNFLLSDATSATEFLRGFNAMMNSGDVFVNNLNKDKGTERAAMLKPFNLPDSEFEVLVSSHYIRKDESFSKTQEYQMTFRDKWHFINWYRHSRAMNPEKRFIDFAVNIDGKDLLIDAKSIDNWKMKPVPTIRGRVSNERAQIDKFKSFQDEFKEDLREWQAEIDKKSPYRSVRDNAGRTNPIFTYFVSDNIELNREDFSDKFNQHLDIQEEKKGSELQPIDFFKGEAALYMTEADYDLLRDKVNSFLGKEDTSADIMERGALSFARALDSDQEIANKYEEAQSALKQALCGVKTGSCALYSKAFFLQQASEHYRSAAKRKNMPLATAARAASNEVSFMMQAISFDPREMEGNWIEASQSLFNEIKADPRIQGIDVESFAPVAAILDSYTSGGIELASNVELSNFLMYQGLIRLSSGNSDFVSPEVITRIRQKESEDILNNVRGERAASLADHLVDINNLIKNYTKDGVFQSDRFIKEAKKRTNKRTPAALASMIGKNTVKFSNLALGLLGDRRAIPIDLNNIDMFNVHTGSRDIYILNDEGGVINPEIRLKVINNLISRGVDINEAVSDAQLFEALSNMKAGENQSDREYAKKAYRGLIGNNLVRSRDLDSDQRRKYHRFIELIQTNLNRQNPGWTPFSVSQALYMLGKISWSAYKGSSSDFKYTDAYERSKTRGRYKNAAMLDEMLDSPLRGEAFEKAARSEEEVKPSLSSRRRYFIQSLNKLTVPAHDLQYFKYRTKEDIGNIEGPILSIKNAELDVDQEARRKIVTFKKAVKDITNIKGQTSEVSPENANFDGVRATFDPFRSNLFLDVVGRPVKGADEVTVVGNTVYMRGNIQYHDLNSDLVKSGRKETERQTEKRKSRGKKFENRVDRYIAWRKANDPTYDVPRQVAEEEVTNMKPSSAAALSNSEMAGQFLTSIERAAVSSSRKKMRGTADRLKNNYGSDVRAEISRNPENYIIPQKIKELKADLMDMTDQELIDIMTDDHLIKMSQRQNDMGVLAISELINRSVLRGELNKIPDLVAEAAKYGTGAGRILRHLRELKKSSPEGIVATIKSLVEKRGNKLSEEQEKKLNDLAGELFLKQSAVNDLTARAIRGEKVDAELNQAIEDLKDVERRLDTIGNSLIEKGWGDIISTLIVGNLLTPMSQMVNVAANAANLFAYTVGDVIALPVKSSMDAIAKHLGKEVQSSGRRYSVAAYMYGLQKFGAGFIDAKDVITTGQEKDISEWRISRGLMPIRSIMAAINANELPLGIDGKASMSQRFKLLAQGTFGIPAETMLRLLSLGDLPFRRFIEGIEVYQEGLDLGLEGEALSDFIKHPPMRVRSKVAAEGRKLTFQEETIASKAALSMINAMERTLAMGVDQIPGMNGTEFAKVFFRTIVPYRSTPANILAETLTYASPYFGVLKMASEVNRGDTRSASQTIAKMAIGAVVMETALMLMSEGILSGPVDWFDDEEKNLSFSEGGFPATSVNVSALKRMINGEPTAKQEGDEFFNYMKLGIPGMLMATAAHSTNKEDIKKENFGSPVKFTTDAIMNFFGTSGMSAAGAMTEQSFLQGVNEFLQVLVGREKERSAENLLKSMVGALSATVLPNTASAIYRTERVYLPDTRVTKDMDFAERLATKLEYTIKDRMFGLGEVPIRVDWKGDKIKQTPEGSSPIAYQLFDVTKARVAGSEPVSNEVYRLYEQTGDISKIVSTPRFASTRVVDIPQIISKKEKTALNNSGRFYSFFDDEAFLEAKIYLNTAQINQLAAVANKQRYNDALELVNSAEYSMMTDEERIEALNEVNKEYNGIKRYDGRDFKPHTILMFDILQDIYDNGEWEEN